MKKDEIDWSAAEQYAEGWKKRVVATYGQPAEWREDRSYDCACCCAYPQLTITALVFDQGESVEEMLAKEDALEGITWPEDSKRQPSFLGSICTFEPDELQ